MESVTLDTPVQTVEAYASFWQRLGALFLDFLIQSPLIAIVFYNMLSWKDFSIFLLVSLLSIIYKPFFEYTYGATPGKMALKIKVTNPERGKINLQQAIMRNIFTILYNVVGIFMTYGVFHTAGFDEADTFMKYGQFAQQASGSQIFGYVYYVVILIDCIFLWTDKQNRSLHDRIGQTLVLQKNRLDPEL